MREFTYHASRITPHALRITLISWHFRITLTLKYFPSSLSTPFDA